MTRAGWNNTTSRTPFAAPTSRADAMVKTGPDDPETGLPKYPRKQTFPASVGMSQTCHVWTAPRWQGKSSRRRLGRCCQCVRPFGAVHMTAGHNALRGSGPGQKRAFDDAMAQVGCPDRRIDRLCITCCSPSQPSHHAGYGHLLSRRSG
jgi:hypothetical protein